MILEVKVIPHARRNSVKEEGIRLKAYVTAPAEGGRANKALINLIAGHFNIRKNRIRIVKGEHSSNKTIEIEDQA